LAKTTQDLFAVIAETLKVDISEVTLDKMIGDIDGWDSLAQTNLTIAVEKAFSFSFSVDEMIEIEGIEDFVEIMAERDIITKD